MKKENPAKQFDKCLDISDRWDLFFTERVSMIFAKLFVKLDWHPNLVTFLGGVFGVAGAVCFAFDNLVLSIIGVLLVIFYAILDCADGQVARMSKKGSLFGRCFDGFIDSVVYVSMYFFIGIRLMNQTIPFTDTLWSFWIFLVFIPFGIIFHTSQCRVADYYRNVHMYLSACERGNELSRAIDIKEKRDSYTKFDLNKIMYNFYYSYTKAQERPTKNLQKLLDMIRENGNVIPEIVCSHYRKESNKIARLANALVFNVRSYVLFALLIVDGALSTSMGISFFIIPFTIFILDPIKIFLLVRYERIAKECIKLMEVSNDEVK